MKYGFIGCGNMGSAIAKALHKKTDSIMVSDTSGKAKALGYAYGSAAEAAAQCPRLFLGVKPQTMGAVLGDLQDILQEKKPLLISMAAGLTMEKISQMAGGNLPIIRIMPNTPVAIGKGVILYCCNELVAQETLEDFLADMSASGEMVALDESLFDAGTSLSGCGPAFVYMFLQAMAEGAAAWGIEEATALRLAAATVSGAAEMVKATEQHPIALRNAVCSPGGSTIAGVRVLEENALHDTVTAAITASYRRNQELGK